MPSRTLVTAPPRTVRVDLPAYVFGLPDAANLVSFWPLNEESGTVAYDLASGHHGTYVGAIRLADRGPGRLPVQALNDGTEYISVPYSPDFDLNAFTIIGSTLYFPAYAGGASLQTALFCKTVGGGSNTGYQLYLNRNAYPDTISVTQLIKPAGAFVASGSAGLMLGNVLDVWAMTYDGASMSTYRNGALIVGPNAVGSPTKGPGINYIGSLNPGGYATVGCISMVMIFRAALSVATILDISNKARGL